MAVKLDDDKLTITNINSVLPNNLNKINALNDNSYFSNDEMNFYGRQLVYFLCNSSHLDLQNPEPMNLEKNTLAKVLRMLSIIDSYFKKPLSKYNSRMFNEFIADFGQITKNSKSNRKMDKNRCGDYLREFKRLWKIYRQYQLKNNKKFNYLDYEWALNLKAPKIAKRVYEQFPELTVSELLNFVKYLHKEEYKLRTLLSVNLMGRKCEITNLTKGDIEQKLNGEIWVKLPNIKKHSSEKVRVELFSFVKKPLLDYLNIHKFKNEDKLFPSNDEAFAKNLKETSEKILKTRINPKTLRKIGLSIAEKLGYSRADCERIGGWATNSPVLVHYFQRKDVAVIKQSDNALEKSLNSSLYEEVEKLRVEEKKKDSELDTLKKQMEHMNKVLMAIQNEKNIQEGKNVK